MRRDGAPTVAVFGAGISGLTAAHELAMRGFGVTVYEHTTYVGGSAASQYSLPPGFGYGPLPPPAWGGPDPHAWGERQTVGGHVHGVRSPRPSPFGVPRDYLATPWGMGGPVLAVSGVGLTVWHTPTGRVLLEDARLGGALAVAVSSDGSRVAVGHASGHVTELRLGLPRQKLEVRLGVAVLGLRYLAAGGLRAVLDDVRAVVDLSFDGADESGTVVLERAGSRAGAVLDPSGSRALVVERTSKGQDELLVLNVTDPERPVQALGKFPPSPDPAASAPAIVGLFWLGPKRDSPAAATSGKVHIYGAGSAAHDRPGRTLAAALVGDVLVTGSASGVLSQGSPEQAAAQDDPGDRAYLGLQPAEDGTVWRVWTARHDLGVRVDRFDPTLGVVVQDLGREPTRALAGEHGFRLFAGFYRHLFDSMRRIPLPEQAGRSTFDRLVPCHEQAVAYDDGLKQLSFSRRPHRSIEGILLAVKRLLAGTGASAADLARFQLKLLEYATACDGRRREWEDLTWWDFVEGDLYAPAMQDAIRSVPRVLIALDGKECDARSQGSALLQFLLTDAQADAEPDRVLDGPASEALFEPWRAWLERLGVRFRFRCLLNSVKEVQSSDGPKVEVTARRGSAEEPVDADYVVLALPPHVLRRVIAADTALPEELERVVEFPLGGALPWMTGLQYYLGAPLELLRGHLFFPTTPWGLSAVASSQFRVADPSWAHGVGSVLSAILCDWEAPAPPVPADPRTPWEVSGVPGRTARECAPDQVAAEVWRQLHRVLDGHSVSRDKEVRPRRALPEPLWWHMDRMVWRSGDAWTTSGARYLVNVTGHWKLRPGRVGATHDELLLGYELAWDRVVLAGTLPRTSVRLSTMESACEAGRHAVNGILRQAGYGGERCALFPMERWEPEDTLLPKRLDALLFEAGLPHALRILHSGDATAALLAHRGSAALGDEVLLAALRSLVTPAWRGAADGPFPSRPRDGRPHPFDATGDGAAGPLADVASAAMRLVALATSLLGD